MERLCVGRGGIGWRRMTYHLLLSSRAEKCCFISYRELSFCRIWRMNSWGEKAYLKEIPVVIFPWHLSQASSFCILQCILHSYFYVLKMAKKASDFCLVPLFARHYLPYVVMSITKEFWTPCFFAFLQDKFISDILKECIVSILFDIKCDSGKLMCFLFFLRISYQVMV